MINELAIRQSVYCKLTYMLFSITLVTSASCGGNLNMIFLADRHKTIEKAANLLSFISI